MQKFIEAMSWIDHVATIVLIGLILILLVIVKNLHSEYGWNDKALNLGIILLVIILAYPLYTGFILQLEIGFIANIASLILTLSLRKKLMSRSRRENQWLWPQIIWLCIASVYIGAMLIEDHLVH
ncbi:MAG: hypothetical protein HKO90_07505 [Flavobacteriaceae bacterium]|nr:hypothetical protein [Bacteroidia bacterium]NNK88114.1 hypothetical protein [Flavobacteriaceae bacterium]